ncbi:carboxypeptidase-like regulatory domain-containing protein [Halosolutus gelatinilyticus]|uniref:carboxypeptidase-like regulatory domain-containing protein n=1 Tax=Halosolutus gelatinilyticus TaxID=2931975 RepID=UPI001FF39FA4|nr:carboxypeptidase-like regulatory domain-containing protein [Halosolutus gelatinilyticus]
MNVPPLLKLVAEAISVRQLLYNRFTILLAVLLLVSIPVQGYAAANSDGYVTGQVVDGDGEPIANATVTLSPQTIAGVPDTQSTTTDGAGEFEFRDESLLEFTIEAQHPERGESETRRHHLYFKGQNTEVTLVLS